jgi:hypothetical protein
LPERLDDLCLDLGSRQADILNQMGIVPGHLLELQANAFPIFPGRNDASQGRQVVATARSCGLPYGRSWLRCLMQSESMVHGNLHMVEALDLKEA